MNLYRGEDFLAYFVTVVLFLSFCVVGNAQNIYRVTRKSSAEIEKAKEKTERQDSIFDLVASVKNNKKLNLQVYSSYPRSKTLQLIVNVYNAKTDTLVKKFVVGHNVQYGLVNCKSYDLKGRSID